ncbi:MAG TPA: HU family DNA-binding protein [Bacteroidales bacterium]|nr:HU family DNA-binding protein [Bacteroidales bacterium]
MSLKYKVISTYKPGEGKQGEQIWFPKLTGSSQVTLADMAQILAERSTASEADVYLIMVGMMGLIPELLGEGKTIKIENFGTFRLHAKVKTESSPEKITVRNIKELRLSFRPDKEIKKAISKLKPVKELKSKGS